MAGAAPTRSHVPPTAEPTTTEIPLPLRTQVRLAIERAWGQAVAAGMLPVIADDAASPEVEIERPAQPEHGDLATSLAVKLARPYRQSPMAIASAIAAELRTATAEDPAGTPITGADVAAPGFLNLRLAERALAATIDAVLRNPSAWGRVEAIRPRSVNVEFVSANPTGPLTVGNARGAFVGDLLCRVLEAVGHDVTREYYFNDSGTQVELLGASVKAVKLGRPVPDDGYHGQYVADLADTLPEDVWGAAQADPDGADWIVGEWASRE